MFDYIVYIYNCNFHIHRHEYFRANDLTKLSSFHVTITSSGKNRLLFPWAYRQALYFYNHQILRLPLVLSLYYK